MEVYCSIKGTFLVFGHFENMLDCIKRIDHSPLWLGGTVGLLHSSVFHMFSQPCNVELLHESIIRGPLPLPKNMKLVQCLFIFSR